MICADPAIAKSVDSSWERANKKLDRFSDAEALDMAISGFDKSDFVEAMNMLDAHLG